MKSRGTESYEDWLRIVLQDHSDAYQWRNVWLPQDIGAVVRRWSTLLRPDQVTLLCLDGYDRGLTPRTFERLLGLPEHLLDPDPARSNRSLTFGRAELLRAINARAVSESWSGEEYWRLVQQGVVRVFNDQEPPAGSAAIPSLPDWAVSIVRERARRQYDDVIASGAQLIGDPEALLSVPDSTTDDGTTEAAAVDLDELRAIASGFRRGALVLRDAALAATPARTTPVPTPVGADQLSGRELISHLRRRVRRRLVPKRLGQTRPD